MYKLCTGYDSVLPAVSIPLAIFSGEGVSDRLSLLEGSEVTSTWTTCLLRRLDFLGSCTGWVEPSYAKRLGSMVEW